MPIEPYVPLAGDGQMRTGYLIRYRRAKTGVSEWRIGGPQDDIKSLLSHEKRVLVALTVEDGYDDRIVEWRRDPNA